MACSGGGAESTVGRLDATRKKQSIADYGAQWPASTISHFVGYCQRQDSIPSRFAAADPGSIGVQRQSEPRIGTMLEAGTELKVADKSSKAWADRRLGWRGQGAAAGQDGQHCCGIAGFLETAKMLLHCGQLLR